MWCKTRSHSEMMQINFYRKTKHVNIWSSVVTWNNSTVLFIHRGNLFHCEIMEWEFFISRLEAVTVSSGEHNLSRVQQRISRTSSLYKSGCVPVQRKRRKWQGSIAEGSFVPGRSFSTSKMNCHRAEESGFLVCACCPIHSVCLLPYTHSTA